MAPENLQDFIGPPDAKSLERYFLAGDLVIGVGYGKHTPHCLVRNHLELA